jgi:CMP-N-acetylneuraminic acid synthetase
MVVNMNENNLSKNNVKVIAIIPAKGQSKRLPNKNKLIINGKPMLYWAINACKESKYNIDVWVSSEDNDILEMAKSFGAKPFKRDPSLSNPNTFKQEVIRDVINKLSNDWTQEEKPDLVISLQPNSPQIMGSHLDKGIETLIDNNRNEIFSVNSDLMQNGAFRIMKADYVNQRDLSTYCGVVICDLIDIHEKEDLDKVEGKPL